MNASSGIDRLERELAWSRRAVAAYAAYRRRERAGRTEWNAARTAWRAAVEELIAEGATQSLIARACEVDRSLICQVVHAA